MNSGPKPDLPHEDDIDATKETIILDENQQTFSTRMVEAKPAKTGKESGAKYEIIKSLGRGGFAWVYLVRNLDLDRLEAMKILNREVSEDEDVINLIVKEARISANFNHQNIVTVYEVQKKGTWDQFKAPEQVRKRNHEPFAYFTMSFVEGETATKLVRQQVRLPQKDSIKIAMDACAALDYAHGKGVIHRDIKPDNIMVDRKGNGIVMDFGIAKVADQTRQTAAGTLMGTVRYVSPEQARGGEIDGRSDIYSLGVTLYEMVTGKVPFDSDQWMTILYKHINEPPPPPEQYQGDLDRDLRGIILKMMEKKPEDRFQTASQARMALAQVYLKLGGQDRGTKAMDQIATRRDLLPGEKTDLTEVPPPPRVDTLPPVRAKGEEQRKSSKRASKPLLKALLIAAPVLAVIVLFFLLGNKQPAQSDDPLPAPVVVTGKVLVSAFPKGQLEKITNQDGLDIPFDDAVLPLVLTLPEGTYRIIISYMGRTAEETGYVSPNIGLARVNAEFDMEEDLFLLEDLR